MHDSLRRNSLLLISAQAITAGAAFAFWIICAHLFSAEEVGLATAFISFGGLVSAFTNLGLSSTIVRFLPRSKHKGGIFSAAVLLVFSASLTGSIIAVILVDHLSPRLSFIQHDWVAIALLMLLIVGSTISGLMDGTLMAFRRGEYILSKALITNLPRIILPFFVVRFATKGMVSVYVIMIAVGTSYNIVTIVRKLLVNESFKPRLQELINHKSYAASNYFGGMLGILPSTLVPIIVLNKLGAAQAAFFYMPMQMAAFLNVISGSTSQALISESSQTEDIEAYRKHFGNAAKHLYRMLIPAIIIVVIIGWPVLKIYGGSYAEHGFYPLVLLALSSVFVAVNWLGDTLLNIQKRSLAYFLMNGFNALVVIVAVYSLARHGLIAVGLGWLIAQVISALVYLVIFARSQLIDLASRFKISS